MKLRYSNCKYCTIDEIADGESKVVFHSHCGEGRSVMSDAERACAECDHHVSKPEPLHDLTLPPFWKPKPGETPTIRLIQPDNIVECLDNTGIGDGFDVGIEYVFEGRHDGEMISVYDKTGTLRECFSSRFKVKSSETTGMFTHRRAMKSV